MPLAKGRCIAMHAKLTQNLISHRGKALDKLKTWLAGGEAM
jgi:inosine/xanthosine triphosphate pyrophosphatase family protein